jgi:hypothetical protein
MNNQSSLTIKIFIGYLENGEIKMYLNQSSNWKEAKILQVNDLIETLFQSREYIGKFIESSLTYEELRQKEKEIRNHLQVYCPKLNLDKHNLCIFPQIFLL